MEVRFGQGGNSKAFELGGWSIPEGGFTWTEGNESHLVLPSPEQAGPHTLEIDAWPFVCAGRAAQRLVVRVNDLPIGSLQAVAAGRLVFPVPASAIPPGSPIHVQFLFPDATRPVDLAFNADLRFLGFAFRRLQLIPSAEAVLGMDPRHAVPYPPMPPTASERARHRGDDDGPASEVTQLLLRFQSLGLNCEFGALQRQFGAEPLDLLRFSATPIQGLIEAIEHDLDGIGTASQTETHLLVNPPDYRELTVRDKRYGFLYHTWELDPQAERSGLLARELTRLLFKKRKFLEDLASGERIYVRTIVPGVDTLESAIPLHAALSRRRPNTLLCVTVADDRHTPGSVEQVEPGMLCGYVDRFSRLPAQTDILQAQWIELCRKTLQLTEDPHAAKGTGARAEPGADGSIAIDVVFGKRGNGVLYQIGGWSVPEESFTWTEGHESHVLLPPPGSAGPFDLMVNAAPFVPAPGESQRLVALVNDVPAGSRTVSQTGTFRFPVPDGAIRAHDSIHVRFQNPDAARPLDRGFNSDLRYLAFAFRSLQLVRRNEPGPELNRHASAWSAPSPDGGDRPRSKESSCTALGPPLRELMLAFQGLGYGCEFGLVQRRCGAEPLDLFRFGVIPMQGLVDCLESGLEGLGEPAQTDLDFWDPRPEEFPREFATRDRRYGLVYHTFVHEQDATASSLLRQELVRLRFKKRKFLEDLARADRVFVRTFQPDTDTLDGAVPLYQALVRRGAHTLLCVTLADASHPPGTVELAMPGLLVGYLERYSVRTDHTDLAFDNWLSICRGAYAMYAGRAA